MSFLTIRICNLGKFSYTINNFCYCFTKLLLYFVKFNIGIFYTGSGFTAGTYQVQIYCDGFLIGSIELPMR